MIIVQIIMQVLPEKQKEVVQTLRSLMAPTEREPGCRRYAVQCDIEDENRLCVQEEWADRHKLDQHLRSDVFGVLLGIKSLLRQSHGIQIYTVQKAEGMNAVVSARRKREAGAAEEIES